MINNLFTCPRLCFIFVVLVKSSFYFMQQPDNLGLKCNVFQLNLNQKLAARLKIVLAVHHYIEKSKKRFKSTRLKNHRDDTKTWLRKHAKSVAV